MTSAGGRETGAAQSVVCARGGMASLSAMLPYESAGIYEQPKQKFTFKVPRVVSDQKTKFEQDDWFKKVTRLCEVSAGIVRSDSWVSKT